MRSVVSLLANYTNTAGKGTYYGPSVMVKREAASDTPTLQLNITPTTIATSSTVTVSLQGSLDNVNWYAIGSSSFTAITTQGNTVVTEELGLTVPLPYYVRAQIAITNSGADTTSVCTASVLAMLSYDQDEIVL